MNNKNKYMFFLFGMIFLTGMVLISGCIENGEIKEVKKTTETSETPNTITPSTDKTEINTTESPASAAPSSEGKNAEVKTTETTEDWCNKKDFVYLGISGIGQSEYNKIRSSGNYNISMVNENISNVFVKMCCVSWSTVKTDPEDNTPINYVLRACNDKEKKYMVFDRAAYVNKVLYSQQTRKITGWVQNGKNCTREVNSKGVLISELCF